MAGQGDAPGGYRSGLPGLLGTIDVALSKVESAILALGVIALASNTIIGVVSRQVFGKGLFWSDEVNRILIILITFAGIGYAARQGRHIRMSALYDALPRPGRKVMMVIIAFATSAVMFFLCYHAYQYIATLQARGRVLPALGLPIWWIYVWVPVGLAVTGVQYFLTGIHNLNSHDVYLSTGVLDGYADSEPEA